MLPIILLLACVIYLGAITLFSPPVLINPGVIFLPFCMAGALMGIEYHDKLPIVDTVLSLISLALGIGVLVLFRKRYSIYGVSEKDLPAVSSALELKDFGRKGLLFVKLEAPYPFVIKLDKVSRENV